ncbi:hypothetical protein LBBP_03715 [Leptospira borgpetersenii serovar Ballum]|uniref:Uncharacterized protein n=1 Tax=Leptospira borgpetersenii serovar Ballum TaxID=280505 RepID=A0A0S2IW64_LEPBO|nr:hypothetical protein LBBP_03715 [Leptospira borgpetersenii serovar Ballum]
MLKDENKPSDSKKLSLHPKVLKRIVLSAIGDEDIKLSFNSF